MHSSTRREPLLSQRLSWTSSRLTPPYLLGLHIPTFFLSVYGCDEEKERVFLGHIRKLAGGVFRYDFHELPELPEDLDELYHPIERIFGDHFACICLGLDPEKYPKMWTELDSMFSEIDSGIFNVRNGDHCTLERARSEFKTALEITKSTTEQSS